jgi:serine protease AprX
MPGRGRNHFRTAHPGLRPAATGFLLALLLVASAGRVQDPGVAGKIHPALRAAAGGDSLLVWVWLRDRGMTGGELQAALARARQQLSARALERRARRGRITGVTTSDLPLHPPYLEALRSGGLRLRRTSRWLNAASGVVAPTDLEKVADHPWVVRVTPLGRGGRRPTDPEAPPEEGRARPSFPAGGAGGGPARPAAIGAPAQTGPEYFGHAWNQNLSLQIPALHEAGYRGEDILIGLMDTGFDTTHVVFQQLLAEGRLLGQYDFINDDGVVANEAGDLPNQHNHGTETWSVIAADWPGTGRLVGVAPDASFLLAKTEDLLGESTLEEDNWIAAIEWMEGLGVDVTSTSLSYLDWYGWRQMDGDTAPITIAADAAAARGVVVVSSAGNDGGGSPPSDPDAQPLTYYVGAPADGDSVIAVGATEADGTRAAFSSHGPTFDGRRKPDLVARGVSVAVATPSASDSSLTWSDGTSYSSPLTAGSAALLLQVHPDWNPHEVLMALRATADRSHNNIPGVPDNDYGWGYVQAWDASGYQIGPVLPGPELEFYAYPNPFGDRGEPGCVFRCSLPEGGRGTIRIYTRAGTLVRVLEVESAAAAVVEIPWDGRNASGRAVAPGAYPVVLNYEGRRAIITVLKVR